MCGGVLGVRVHTLEAPVVGDMGDLYRAIDGGACASLLAKLAIEKSLLDKMEETRSAYQVHNYTNMHSLTRACACACFCARERVPVQVRAWASEVLSAGCLVFVCVCALPAWFGFWQAIFCEAHVCSHHNTGTHSYQPDLSLSICHKKSQDQV